jgi:hypothetical protein
MFFRDGPTSRPARHPGFPAVQRVGLTGRPPALDGGGMSGASRTADKIFAGLAAITALAVVVQVFLAGVGVFGMDAPKAEDAGSFDLHRGLGEIIGGLTLLMLIAALVARASRRVMWTSIVLFLLAEFAQHGLASGGNSNKWVGGLHALDGVVILLMALWLHLDSRPRLRAASAPD